MAKNVKILPWQQCPRHATCCCPSIYMFVQSLPRMHKANYHHHTMLGSGWNICLGEINPIIPKCSIWFALWQVICIMFIPGLPELLKYQAWTPGSLLIHLRTWIMRLCTTHFIVGKTPQLIDVLPSSIITFYSQFFLWVASTRAKTHPLIWIYAQISGWDILHGVVPKVKLGHGWLYGVCYVYIEKHKYYQLELCIVTCLLYFMLCFLYCSYYGSSTSG